MVAAAAISGAALCVGCVTFLFISALAAIDGICFVTFGGGIGNGIGCSDWAVVSEVLVAAEA